MYKNKKLWEYEIAAKAEFKSDLIETYKFKGKFLEDCIGLFELMGISPHPSMKISQGKEHIEPVNLNFNHILVDINSIKILECLLPNSKLIALKFSSNNFEFQVLEILINTLLIKPNNIITLVFEWNSNIRIENKEKEIKEAISWEKHEEISKQDEETGLILYKSIELVTKLGSSSKIESLCLRGNYLGDDGVSLLCEHLKSNSVLRFLNLHNNLITTKGFTAFCKMLEFNRKLEDVNFGKNKLVNSDLQLLTKSIGKFQLSHEEVEIHNKKLKERDSIIEKNKKLKTQKKPEEPVPLIDEVSVIGDKTFLIKNLKIKNLNFIENKFENPFDHIVQLLQHAEFLNITVDFELFNKDQKYYFTYPSVGNYYSRIYLSK